MKRLFLFFSFTVSILSAQSIDYNLKKGFIANGYDVVSYFYNETEEGKTQFTASYEDTKLKFSSKENLDTFNKNPKKYLPQYGGYCAYAVAVKSAKVSINPKSFLVKNGKLYLFYNSWGTNTLDLWQQENPTILEKKANNNWQKIKYKK